VFTHRFGDCKDKATLLSAMLREIGIESYYVIINTERGSITATTPANLEFDHAILAIALPAGVEDARLLAMAASFTTFQILKASVGNLHVADRPFEWNYTVEAEHYAKVAGDLLLVRMRVLGSKSRAGDQGATRACHRIRGARAGYGCL
jgi:hypothetical protein